MQRTLFFFLYLSICLLPVGMVAGQSASPNFVVQRFVVGSSVSAESASFHSTGVVGQAATDISSSPNYRVNGGFLLQRSAVPTAVSISTSSHSAAAPLVLIITASSLLLIAAAYLHRRQTRHHRT